MKKILCMLLAAMMLAGLFGDGSEVCASTKEPSEQWAAEHGWSKKSDRYEKTVDGISYQLWCGRNAYDKLSSAEYTWQIMTTKSADAVGTINVPGEIDGFPVKSVGPDTFRANTAVTECIIEEGVEVIGTGAFENCGSITKVTMPKSLKMIDANAFYNCPNLSELHIPEAVKYVAKTSFCGESISGKGLENLTFAGNAPEILYADTASGEGLSGIGTVAVNVYENTTGWDQIGWKNHQLNYLKNDLPTPTQPPAVTEEPTPPPTQTPAVTEEPTPAPTQTPEVTEEPTPIPTQTPTTTETPKNVTEIFEDVSKDWYTDYVQYVYDKGLMKGEKGTVKFKPLSPITKAQAIQVLYNIEGEPQVKGEKAVFEDLKDVYREEWYHQAIAWAYDNKIITGDLNTKKFYPNAGITREELALVFYRYATYKNKNVEVQDDLEGMLNANQVSNWAMDGVKWAVGTKLLQGIEVFDASQNQNSHDLAPKEKTTRGQMAVMMYRFLEGIVQS